MWVGIARVKNESDIIEAFIRHSCCHFDKIIVIDHSSTDGTPNILDALVNEGLPLEVQHSNVFEPQGVALTRLMRSAFSQLEADWIMPLDADEFVETQGGAMLRDRPPQQETQTLEVFWNNFMYIPGPVGEFDQLERMRWRSNESSELPKVAIPRVIGLDPRVVIYEGSHFVIRNKKIVRGRRADDLVLCHFPIRSIEQYRLKIIIGTLRYMINPSQDIHLWGWHYKEAYDHIINDRIDLLEKLMRSDSLNYSSSKTTSSSIDRPFHRLGGELKYGDKICRPSELSALARYAETVVSGLKKQNKSKSFLKTIEDLSAYIGLKRRR